MMRKFDVDLTDYESEVTDAIKEAAADGNIDDDDIKKILEITIKTMKKVSSGNKVLVLLVVIMQIISEALPYIKDLFKSFLGG